MINQEALLAKLNDAERAFFDKLAIQAIESRLTDPERKSLRREFATLLGEVFGLIAPLVQADTVGDANGEAIKCDTPDSVLVE